MLADFRLAARSLRRQPTFVSAVVLTLALGLGATIAIYSLVDVALLRRLPFTNPDRIVFLWGVAGPERAIRGASFPEVFDWRDRSRTIEGVSIYNPTSVNLRTDEGADRINAEMVSWSFFSTLGATPQLGRTFLPEEDRVPDRDAVVVISDAMWRDRFGGVPSVIGKTLVINDRPFTVVGVMRPGFKGLGFNDDIWFPSMMVGIDGSTSIIRDRGNRYVGALARLRDGSTLESAKQDLDRVARELQRDYPESNSDRAVQLMTLHENYLGGTARLLWTLFAAVLLLLVIACANVAGLQLVRANARTREVALRLALGASRLQLVRQLLAESLLLALVGGVGGVFVAAWGTNALLPLLPAGVLPTYVTPHIDLRVLLFAFVLCAACGVLVGLVPALRSASRDPGLTLKSGGRASSGGLGSMRRAGAQQALVVGEIAVALLLLVGAGLVARSLSRVLDVDPGIRADGVLTTQVQLPRERYSKPEERILFVDRLRSALEALPGVRNVAVGSDAPFVGGWSASMMYVEGVTKDRVRFYLHKTTPGFFTTLGISLLQGRDFNANDRAGTPPVVIVSEATAQRFWPKREAVGQRIRIGGPEGPEFTVVGVAANARFRNLTSDLYAPRAEPDVYFPLAQRTDANLVLAMRVDGDPTTYVKALQSALRGVDAGVPTYGTATLSDNLRAVSATSRFASIAMGAFSVVALALAAIGIYGVMAYLVSMGRREIAIRMALGATRSAVVADTIRHALSLAGAGLALGVIAALLSARMLSSLLFGVTTMDVPTYVAVCAMVLVTTVGASWLPSRRASRVDPQEALRGD